jgi:hypothetical protein
MARVARGIECDAVAYLSPFENHPRAVASLASGRALLGNPPEVLRRVRDPLALTHALRRRGFKVPGVASGFSRIETAANSWLVKPLRSGGGQRIRRYMGGAIPRDSYLQEFVEGIPGSVVFLSAAGRSLPIAITRQLVGDAAFGASGFRYCGSLLASAGPVGAERLAAAVTEEFGLVGVNVVDFVARDGVPYAVEVNPRWSGSMELVDAVVEEPLFALHARACLTGEPPPWFLTWRWSQRGPVIGKAIVFARRDVVIPSTDAWLGDPSIRDVPHEGERIAAGQPICTVLADGVDSSACYAALAHRAEDIYSEIGSPA